MEFPVKVRVGELVADVTSGSTDSVAHRFQGPENLCISVRHNLAVFAILYACWSAPFSVGDVGALAAQSAVSDVTVHTFSTLYSLRTQHA